MKNKGFRKRRKERGWSSFIAIKHFRYMPKMYVCQVGRIAGFRIILPKEFLPKRIAAEDSVI